MKQVFDLRKEEAGFQPLPLSAAQRNGLRRAIVSTVQKAEGASKVLQTYSNELTEWLIPPLYSGMLGAVSLQVASTTVTRKSTLRHDFDGFMSMLDQRGWDGVVVRRLQGVFGTCANSPWMFDKQNRCLGRAAVEYAVALSKVRGCKLFLQGDSAAAIYDGTPIGVIDGVVVGTNVTVTAEQIYDWLLSPRGVVLTKNYGVYDRILKWSEGAYDSVLNIDGFKTALALVKLSLEPEEEDADAQILRTFALKERPTTGENQVVSLDQIYSAKNAWILTEGSDEEKLQKLFEAVVPYIFDSVKFKQLFGVLPEENLNLTDRQVARIDNGLEKFTQACLKLRRDHERV